MIIIEADLLLANLLRIKEVVTLKDLKYMRDEIESSIGNVHVDISRNSILSAIEERPDLFEWSNDSVTGVKHISRKYVDDNFNWRIPPAYIKTFRRILRDYELGNKTD